MNGNNVVEIIKSPAVTVIVISLCALLIMNRVLVVMTTIKAIKKED
jgi:hypothetical protein